MKNKLFNGTKLEDRPICGVVDSPTIHDNRKLILLIEAINKFGRTLTKINTVTTSCVDVVYYDAGYTRLHFHFDEDKWSYVPVTPDGQKTNDHLSWTPTINEIFIDETREEQASRLRGEMWADLLCASRRRS